MRILVVEDHAAMADVLRRGLSEEGYAVDVADSGEEGTWLAAENEYDVIVLDLVLPDIDGFTVCRVIRAHQRWSPILMLTARDAVEDRVRGLDAGADDYMMKPFAFSELLARVRALVRRGAPERPSAIAVDDLLLDPSSRTVTRSGRDIELTAKEFALLEYLMRHAGEALSRARLIEHVWDFAFDGDSNVVEVYVRYLREKIDRPFGRASIETVRGYGYRFKSGAEDAPVA